MKKAIILASMIVLLVSTALSVPEGERISFLPPNKPIFVVIIKLYIDREGKISLYSTRAKDEWWSEGYVYLVFRIPPNPTRVSQNNGKGTGQRIITGCTPVECAKSYSVHPVVYKVVEYKPYLRVRDWRIIGWKVKIRETWKPGKAWGTYWGTFSANQLVPMPGFHLDTYWVLVPFLEGGTTTSSWRNNVISWKNKFKVSKLRVRPIGSTGDE
jgi:hypothetical protein